MIFLKFKLFNTSYMKLQKLIKIKKGQQLNKEFLYKKNEKDINLFPVINGGKEPSGWWWKSNFDKNLITISQGGASCGYVQWQYTKFWAGAHCYVIMIINNKLNYKFIYYFLKNKEKLLMKNQKGAGIPSLDTKTIYNLEIPIPPIEVQNKVVEILDKFTNYKAELTAELTFREEQYKYYRDKLLNFNELQNWKKLNELIKINPKSKYGVNKANKEFNNGKYPFFTSGSNVHFFDKWMVDGRNIFMNDGGTADFKFFEGKSYYSDHVISFSSKNEKIILNKFLFYILESKKDYIELNYFKGSGIKNISKKEFFSNYEIPIPPIEIQNKIVEILDKFSSLINDIQNGLPKEIELRNKQYEYYRNFLLDFGVNDE